MFYSRTHSGCLFRIPYSFHGYKFIDYLNSGFDSIVIKVEDKKNCQQYAAKIISKKEIKNRNKIEMIHNEINILNSIDHPNIIKLYESFEIKNKFDEEYIVMIMEYCSNGDLFDYATQVGFKNDFEKKDIFYNFLKAIEYLHNRGISHGDIKPENILLDENLNPKLCDFGFSRKEIISTDQNRNFTIYYAAPELFQKGELDLLKVDIWAVGITLYCLYELKFPFSCVDDDLIMDEILSGYLTIETDEKLQTVIEKCTGMQPCKRPDIDEILNDEFFQF